MQPDLMHAAKLDRELVVKWLTGEAIYPIKTRSYHWENNWENKGSNKRVVETQRILHRLNYLSSDPDFAYGPETRAAILKFQREHNLTETQLPDNTTLEALQKLTGKDNR
jgi:peptidoglycan hydrolase-like protein with peptidoglycan-binding domain